MESENKGLYLANMFTWVAEYLNKSSLIENKVKSNFYEIDKESLLRYYYKGPIIMGFQVFDGKFFIQDSSGSMATVDVKLKSDSKNLDVTRPSTDIIQFKDASMATSFTGMQAGGSGILVESLNIGYKWKDEDISAKILLKLSWTGELSLHITLVSKDDFEGNLVINGVNNKIQLQAGVSSTYNLEIRGRCYS